MLIFFFRPRKHSNHDVSLIQPVFHTALNNYYCFHLCRALPSEEKTAQKGDPSPLRKSHPSGSFSFIKHLLSRPVLSVHPLLQLLHQVPPFDKWGRQNTTGLKSLPNEQKQKRNGIPQEATSKNQKVHLECLHCCQTCWYPTIPNCHYHSFKNSSQIVTIHTMFGTWLDRWITGPQCKFKSMNTEVP